MEQRRRKIREKAEELLQRVKKQSCCQNEGWVRPFDAWRHIYNCCIYEHQHISILAGSVWGSMMALIFFVWGWRGKETIFNWYWSSDGRLYYFEKDDQRQPKRGRFYPQHAIAGDALAFPFPVAIHRPEAGQSHPVDFPLPSRHFLKKVSRRLDSQHLPW